MKLLKYLEILPPPKKYLLHISALRWFHHRCVIMQVLLAILPNLKFKSSDRNTHIGRPQILATLDWV
jgi:hypothetical protein